MRYYLLLSLISFVMAFALLTPTRIIGYQLLPNLRIEGWKLHDLQGNILQGQLQARNLLSLNISISWKLELNKLFSRSAVLQIWADSTHSKLHAYSKFNGLQPAFILDGTLDSTELSSKLKGVAPFRMTGTVVIQPLLVTHTPPYYIATGLLQWTGGNITDPQQSSELPALDINLLNQGSILHIKINEQKTQLNLITIQANTHKQANIQITQRLLNLTEQTTLSDNEQDIVLRFTENLTF